MKQAWTGDVATTYGEQVLQSLGMSPEAAAYTYAALGMLPAGLPALEQTLVKIAPQIDALALNAGAKLGQNVDDLANSLAKQSTHAAGNGDRVVLGKWEGIILAMLVMQNLMVEFGIKLILEFGRR